MNWDDQAAVVAAIMGGLRVTAEILLVVGKVLPSKYTRIGIAVQILAKVIAWGGVGKPKKLS